MRCIKKREICHRIGGSFTFTVWESLKVELFSSDYPSENQSFMEAVFLVMLGSELMDVRSGHVENS